MVTGTKNSMDISFKADKINIAGKYNPESYKTYSSKTTSKSEDFKNVLSSKANSKEQNTEKADVVSNESSTGVNDSDKIHELKEKLEELEENSKSASKDEVNSLLNELLNLLAKLGINEEDLKLDGEINSNILKTMLEGINENGASNSNLSSIMEKLMELLKNDSVKDSLDSDSLKLMEKLLNNLSGNLADDNSEAAKGIKNLMSEISNILNAKQNEGKKVLTLEDMLNKNYSQNSSENSGDDTSKNEFSSKEDKFLNSLIDDKDSSLDKINLFASRTATIQNQATDNVRGLTINKATFTNDLIKDIKFMSNNSLKELIVKVNPGNLGEITIKIVEQDGLMKANLKANSKETTALLSQNLTDIKKQLAEQNIKIADVNIELYQEDTTFFREQGFGRQLSEEQGRSNGNSTNSSNDGAIVEEELVDNIASDNSNIVEAFV